MSFSTLLSHDMSCFTWTDCKGPSHHSENGDKMTHGAPNEPHDATHTAVEALESLAYINSREISKVVWNIVPAWFSSVPTMVSGNGFAQNLTPMNLVKMVMI